MVCYRYCYCRFAAAAAVASLEAIVGKSGGGGLLGVRGGPPLIEL